MARRVSDGEFKDHVEEALITFDECLAAKNVPVPQRPFHAAAMFVSYCIDEIEGDKKTNFWGKAWFTHIYKIADDWYHNRYAQAMTSNSNQGKKARGIVLIFATPFEVNFPLEVFRPGTPGETFWMVFPNTVLPEEHVLDWLTHPPNLSSLSTQEIEDGKRQIIAVAEATRSIRVNLMTADITDKDTAGLARDIPGHIDKAIGDILRAGSDGVSVAFWEMHMAVEKVLKTFLRQKGNPLKGHDFTNLLNAAQAHGLSLDSSLFKLLPSSKEAIRLRYSEGPRKSVHAAISAYNGMLEIVRGAYSG